jgi:hypothetical protein
MPKQTQQKENFMAKIISKRATVYMLELLDCPEWGKKENPGIKLCFLNPVEFVQSCEWLQKHDIRYQQTHYIDATLENVKNAYGSADDPDEHNT